MFGLKQQDIDSIVELFNGFPEVEQALVFGSRAMGNYKKGSDVDIVIKGKNIDSMVVAKISYLLNEESYMPYYFDIVHYESITNENLIDHINRAGRIFFDQSL